MENKFDWKKMLFQVVTVAYTFGVMFFVKDYIQTTDWKHALDVAKNWSAMGAIGGFGLNQIVHNMNKTNE